MLQGLLKLFKKVARTMGTVFVAFIFVVAVYLLYHEVSKYSFSELSVSVERIPNWNLFFSIFFAIINYMILVGYDWLALKGIHKKLPLKKVSLVSFVGQAVSYNFGALLGGSTIRYRFYSSWGFSPIEIVKLVLMLAVTFWVGAFGLAGIIFMFAPPTIPPELAMYFPSEDIRPLGLVIFLIAVSYLIICKLIHKPIHIFGKEFSFPPFKIAVAQAVVASADLVAAGACLYVLLPENSGISFIQFLPTYLMAMVAVVLTHVPGGAGVLEIVVLHLTNAAPQGILAALLCFRVIYYLIPLIFAAIIYVIYEVNRQSQENVRLLNKLIRYIRIHIPIIDASLVFIIGIIICFIVMLPVHQYKMYLLGILLPKVLIEVSSIIASISGVLLLFFSIGIKYKRKYILYYTLVIMIIGCIGVLTSTLNFLMTSFIVIIVALLLYTRNSFYLTSSIWKIHFSIKWFITSLCVLACAAGLGISIRHINVTNIRLLEDVYFKDGYRISRILLFEGLTVVVLFLRYIQIRSLQKLRKRYGRSKK